MSRLFLVIGPSGAGKDSLLRGAREALADNSDFVFTRRVITRLSDPDGEDHEVVTPGEFAVRAGTGKFLLHWQAHGNGYGIPASAKDDLAAGRRVIANVSRTVIADAIRLYSPVTVIEITVPPEIHVAAIAKRLARTVPLPPGVTPVQIVNDGTLEEGIETLVEALR